MILTPEQLEAIAQRLRQAEQAIDEAVNNELHKVQAELGTPDVEISISQHNALDCTGRVAHRAYTVQCRCAFG